VYSLDVEGARSNGIEELHLNFKHSKVRYLKCRGPDYLFCRVCALAPLTLGRGKRLAIAKNESGEVQVTRSLHPALYFDTLPVT